MKLYCSHASPYARLVRIVAIEKGLEDQIEIIATNPMSSTELLERNPLGKIPALELASGQTLFDSRVICEYLDALSEQPTLLPGRGEQRWQVHTQLALANGVMDAAVNSVFETRREDTQPSAMWMARWEQAIVRSVAVMAQQAFAEQVDFGNLGCAVALSYLQFRRADIRWADLHPELAAWHKQMQQRPSFEATAPS